jgi:predicted acetyltransferase
MFYQHSFQFWFRICHRDCPRNEVDFELNGTHQFLLCADDDNLLGGSIHIKKENSETLLESSRDIGLEISAEKTKYIIMSRHHNSGQNQITRTANESMKRWQHSNNWG